FFTPERSIEIQKKLGADMMVAFDECAPYPTTFEYARTAMERTHRWAQVSLAAAKSQGPQKQFLFGVIQGSRFKKLRQQSAQLISALPFDGWAIGGVAVGEPKKDMVQALDWVMPVLNKQKTQKPVHLLGVGEIDDIFAAAERGVDLMDCVMPTRLGRMGWILTPKGKDFKIDLNKNIFTEDSHPVGDDCQCEVCRSFTRAYLHHLFRAQELLAYHLATYHNLYFMERLFDKIRMSLKKNEWDRLKKEWLSKQ
ncbi:tRNA-guanine transglycosylase, partial [Candidatus Shapirobacteria bacterium]|nr:tRNA-guanine transglycosylase [Candidatus Shapirobacteria bacterium]